MELNTLRPAPGAKRPRTRVGRGPGSGLGKTSGRGEKGQKSRTGYSRRLGFEGGQMPLVRRLPKRGFTNIFKRHYAVVNIRDLERFARDSVVDVKALRDSGLVKQLQAGIKLLGEGSIQHPLTVKVHACSRSAQQKIEAAGGKVETVHI